MFISLVPWLVFSVMIHRQGAHAAGFAAVIAAVLAVGLLIRDSRHGSVKVVDVTGVLTFGVLAVISFAGGTSVTDWIANYGRGAATLVLAVVMLGSVPALPFTEQYARESVPRQYWGSPTFRSINRRISLVWGAAVLVMAAAHLLAGKLEPATSATRGSRPIDLLLNWVVPILLIMLAINYTKKLSNSESTPARSGVQEPD
jgi:hypothetical protein